MKIAAALLATGLLGLVPAATLALDIPTPGGAKTAPASPHPPSPSSEGLAIPVPAKAAADAEARAKAQADAAALRKAKAEEEARARAKAVDEARAKARAEAEAREKARVRMEAEARAKAQADANARAQARAEAQARARARAEAEAEARARAKAEVDARAKVAADARAKARAEADARARAAAEKAAQDRVRAESHSRLAKPVITAAPVSAHRHDGVWSIVLRCGVNASNNRPAYSQSKRGSVIQSRLDEAFSFQTGLGNVTERWRGEIRKDRIIVNVSGSRDDGAQWTLRFEGAAASEEKIGASGAMYDNKNQLIRDCTLALTRE